MVPVRLVSLLRQFALLWLSLVTCAVLAQTASEDAQGPIRLRQAAEAQPSSNSRDSSSRSDDAYDDASDYDARDRRSYDGRESGIYRDSRDNRRDTRDTRDSRDSRDPRDNSLRDNDPNRRDGRNAGQAGTPPNADPFETYLRTLGSRGVRRYGAELVTGAPQDVPDGNALVPADYVVAPGDELLVTLWGSVDANLRLQVDRAGRITIPRVGAVMVAGVRYADLSDTISKRVAQVFRNYQLSVSLGRLRSIRVYVTGYVKRPGAYTVSALSTIVGALMRAGGPAAAGSFRHIDLRRGKELVTTFDMYDLLIKGDKTADRTLQADDVIHVGPVGPQVALIGSVNKPAIFELKPSDTLGDVVQMAGGFSAVADRSRLAVERLTDRQNERITELALPAAAPQQPHNGDVLRAFSVVDATLPVDRQNKRVKVEGEVLRPGEYVLPPSSSIADALRAAGGLTSSAYVFGTEFNRETVRRTQQENYDRALRDLETEFARAQSTQRAITADEAATFEARSTATTRLITRLRAVAPTGRVVLQIAPDAKELPNLALEDGDQVYVPAKPTTVGVFGSVFNGGSYLYSEGAEIGEFMRQAGGPTRGADTSSTFVIRANGSVVSNQQKTKWLGFSGGIDRTTALAGDTVFVPEEMNKTTWIQSLKEWTQIFYQFGIGAAAVRTFAN